MNKVAARLAGALLTGTLLLGVGATAAQADVRITRICNNGPSKFTLGVATSRVGKILYLRPGQCAPNKSYDNLNIPSDKRGLIRGHYIGSGWHSYSGLMGPTVTVVRK